jgi:pseudouridine kinase
MARRATVLAIGGANLDIKCRPGVPYRAGTSNPGVIEISAGGVANNVARNLGLLGIRVSLVSAIGRDNAGQRLLLEARRAGVNAALCRRSLRRPTGAYVALLDERGELVGAVSDMAIMDELGPGTIRAILPALGRCDIAVADCNLPQATLALLARAAIAREIPLVIDAVSAAKATRLRSLLAMGQHLFALSLNVQEAAVLSPGLRPEAAALRAFAGRLHRAGVANALVHLGQRGVFVSASDSRSGMQVSRLIRAPRSNGRDVTGAGDSALAGTLYGIVRGLDIFAAAGLGQVAAAMTLASTASVSASMSAEALWKRRPK